MKELRRGGKQLNSIIRYLIAMGIVFFFNSESLGSEEWTSYCGVDSWKNNINIPSDRNENIPESGYLVTVNANKKFTRTITKDPREVEQIFQQHLQTDLDIIKILNKSPYFDMKTDQVYFYAEVGTVRSGKKGKLKFRKMKKSER